MIWKIDAIHRFILLLAKKETTAWFSAGEIDDALHRSQMDLWVRYCPIYGQDATAKKALDPFRSEYLVTPANSPNGLVTWPTDLGHLLAGVDISFDNVKGTQYRKVEFVNDDQLVDRLRSQLMPVTVTDPIATVTIGGNLQMYPMVPNTAKFPYLAMPPAPKFNFNQVGRLRSYVEVGSTQLLWNESFLTPIISKALVYLGININDANLIQLMAQQAA